MDALKKTANHPHFWPIFLFLVVAVGFLIFTMKTVRQGAGTTQSKASRDVTLTAGDDALSLQQDLNTLGSDPGMQDEQDLNALQ